MRKLITLLCMVFILTAFSSVEAAMTYDAASKYQQAHPEEIWAVNEELKNIYGEKEIQRSFKFLGPREHRNLNGGKRTCLNIGVNYGFQNPVIEPYAFIYWYAELVGAPDDGYAPKNMYLSFTNGNIVTLSLQGWEYRGQFEPFVGKCHYYWGNIKVSYNDLYAMGKYGDIAALSIDTGNGTITHFFYAGEKNAKQKRLFTHGIQHAIKILEITDESIAKANADAEKARVEKLTQELKAEIKAEEERKALKEKLKAEMQANGEI